MQQLAFVGVEALDLHVEHGGRRDGQPQLPLNEVCQAQLILVLGRQQGPQKRLVVFKLTQLRQLQRVTPPR